MLGQMKVSPGGFAHMTEMLSKLADGRIVLALEVRRSITFDDLILTLLRCREDTTLNLSPTPLLLAFGSSLVIRLLESLSLLHPLAQQRRFISSNSRNVRSGKLSVDLCSNRKSASLPYFDLFRVLT